MFVVVVKLMLVVNCRALSMCVLHCALRFVRCVFCVVCRFVFSVKLFVVGSALLVMFCVSVVVRCLLFAVCSFVLL